MYEFCFVDNCANCDDAVIFRVYLSDSRSGMGLNHIDGHYRDCTGHNGRLRHRLRMDARKNLSFRFCFSDYAVFRIRAVRHSKTGKNHVLFPCLFQLGTKNN